MYFHIASQILSSKDLGDSSLGSYPHSPSQEKAVHTCVYFLGGILLIYKATYSITKQFYLLERFPCVELNSEACVIYLLFLVQS